MFLTMGITLFTSRVILNTLGVVDFGIYNVVGGVVAMMGIFNNAMAVASQRYLTFELGKQDFTRLKVVFNVSMTIYLLLSIFIVVAGETIGLWFLNTKLVIPPERMFAANWVYQFSIISCVVSLLSSPYNASIIAHEKMGIYAYVSIGESVVKLAIVYCLYISFVDKLVTYGALLMFATIIVTGVYFIYCRSKFDECRYSFVHDKKLFGELLSYSGWNIFGSAAGIAKTQGTNVLLNMFFTPVVNAASGIATQVNSVVVQFFSSFFSAVRPQITKYYAQNDMQNMLLLTYRSTKLTCYLILLVSLPLLFETPYILNLWLGFVPEHAVDFVRISIIITMIDSMANPIMTIAHATGRIKRYQFVVGMINIMIVPVAYFILSCGGNENTVFWVSLIMSILCSITRLYIVRWLMGFPIKEYVVSSLLPCIMVSTTAILLPIVVYILLPQGLMRFFVSTATCVLSTITMAYAIGLNKQERESVTLLIRSKIHR